MIQHYSMVTGWIETILSMLMPFVIGAAMAFIINIPMSFFERTIFKKWVKKESDEEGNVKVTRKGFVRPLSMILTIFIAALIVIGFISLVVPQMAQTLVDLARTANFAWPKFQRWAISAFRSNDFIRTRIASLNIDVERIVWSVADFVKNGAGTAFTNVFSAAQAVVTGITSFIIGFVFACYLLTQKENLQRQAILIMEAVLSDKVSSRIKYIAEKCRHSFASFISRQCLETCIIAAMFFVVLSVAGMPYALLISLIIAFSALIPVVGMFLGCCIGALLVFMVNPMQTLVFIIIFVILQQIEGNLIYPRVVGSGVGLPAMWVLMAVIVGSSLMGIVGLFVFIPLTSVIYSLIREWTYKRVAQKQVSESNEREAGIA